MDYSLSMSLLVYFTQSLGVYRLPCYALHFLVGISVACLMVLFQHASTLNENPNKSTHSSMHSRLLVHRWGAGERFHCICLAGQVL